MYAEPGRCWIIWDYKLMIASSRLRLIFHHKRISICPRHPEIQKEFARWSASRWLHGSCTPAVGLTEPPSLPVTVLSRSDCDWTGVSLFCIWQMCMLFSRYNAAFATWKATMGKRQSEWYIQRKGENLLIWMLFHTEDRICPFNKQPFKNRKRFPLIKIFSVFS